MKYLLNVVVLGLMVILAGCGGTTQSTTPSAASMVEGTTILAVTTTPIVVRISTLPPAAGDEASSIDQENQRISDTAYSNLSDKDSFRFDFNLTGVFDHQPDHFQFVLKGDGAVTGLSQSNQVAFAINLNGSATSSTVHDEFTANMRLVGTKLYLMVTATNAQGETRSTPWGYMDVSQTFESEVQANSELASYLNLSDSMEALSPAKIEDFFGLLDFGPYVVRDRLADDSDGVINFQSTTDLIGLLSSREFLRVVDLVNRANGTTPEAMSDEQLDQSLVLMRQQMETAFPTLEFLFHQYINPKVLTMNRLTVELDMQLQDNTLIETNGVIHFSNHGDTINVSAPADAVPLEDIKIEPFN